MGVSEKELHEGEPGGEPDEGIPGEAEAGERVSDEGNWDDEDEAVAVEFFA